MKINEHSSLDVHENLFITCFYLWFVIIRTWLRAIIYIYTNQSNCSYGGRVGGRLCSTHYFTL